MSKIQNHSPPAPLWFRPTAQISPTSTLLLTPKTRMHRRVLPIIPPIAIDIDIIPIRVFIPIVVAVRAAWTITSRAGRSGYVLGVDGGAEVEIEVGGRGGAIGVGVGHGGVRRAEWLSVKDNGLPREK